VEYYFRFAAATVRNGLNPLGEPQTMEMCRESPSTPPGTALEHHFRSAAAKVEMVETGWTYS